ncbi:hypothetical protein PIL02S_01107 [Paenibacillus illinoisensis]|uniref:Uncharacterized protein n=1 Tax=Paenibacillus illinoisensis TaxID=59845 RepID=A0A2W0CKE2_9BACL|nr:hypothetical protein PIL02S_01107 [Paenibacillus illinoisensis]
MVNAENLRNLYRFFMIQSFLLQNLAELINIPYLHADRLTQKKQRQDQ